MYNDKLQLISYVITKDEIGNEVSIPQYREVFCKTKDIGSTEFYNAQIANLKPEIKFIVHFFEYAGERQVLFNGVNYEVVRTYQGATVDNSDNALKDEEIELTCEKVLGNVN